MTQGKKTTWRDIEKSPAISLEKGQMVRFESPRAEAKDGFVYGRASGGFGMSAITMGRAIFVENESWTEEGARERTATDKARWNRGSMPIEAEVVV